jgi:hypothetical protein
MAKNNKATAVLEMLRKGMTNREIRNRMKVSSSYIWMLKKSMTPKVKEPQVEAPQEKAKETDVDALLAKRGSRYGNFLDTARITQRLKSVAHQFAQQHDKTFDVDQAEALDMIFNKIGRILNGDPNYADSWIDIAGYAKLVANRLEGKAR